MSDAALLYVRGCTHPTVKDGTRDLFEAIAHFVPEGETTTPFVGMPDLASQARRSLRTVVKRLPDLVAIGEVLVLDGGLGKIARYQIVHLAGAPPIVAAALPLRADLRSVERRARPRPTLPDDTTGDLFADPPAPYDQTAKNLCRSFIGWIAQPVQIVHRLVVYLCRSFIGWRSDGEKPVQIVHRFVRLLHIRARDVPPLIRTTTTAPAESPPPLRDAKPPPCPSFGRAHAWCDGRVHVPMAFHLEERRKLARQPGETDADLDARMFARYAAILAAIPDTEDLSRYANDFEFWKAKLRGAPSTSARAPTRAPRRSDGVTGSTCPHDPKCTWDPDCIARVIAEGRAERERKAGSG